jgi:vanillate O-demethylase monooxygenase subunit
VFLEIAADWELLNDNLLDLTHLGLVHRKTIGGDPDAHSNAQMRTARTEKGVRVTRWLPDSAPPPHYLQAKDFKGNIDRWQEIDFIPGLIRIWSGGTDAGTGAFEGRREGGVQFMGMHAVTPATETSCYYHFSQARNFALDDHGLQAKLHQGAYDTLLEDKAIIEAQQRRRLETPDRPFIDVRGDAGGLQARRIIRHSIEGPA